MRLFAAVDPGERFRAALTPWLDGCAGLSGVRWTPPRNLHLTLRFLGEQPREALPELVDALRGAAAAGRTGTARCTAPDAFPDRARPRVLILPVHSDGVLEELADRVAAALAPWRPRDPRGEAPFRAHLTLGRVRRGAPRDLPARLRGLADPAPPPFAVTAVRLVASVLDPTGARYTELGSFPLAEAEPRL